MSPPTCSNAWFHIQSKDLMVHSWILSSYITLIIWEGLSHLQFRWAKLLDGPKKALNHSPIWWLITRSRLHYSEIQKPNPSFSLCIPPCCTSQLKRQSSSSRSKSFRSGLEWWRDVLMLHGVKFLLRQHLQICNVSLFFIHSILP